MKTLTLLGLCLLFSTILFSQSVLDLDKKNGFKDAIFGMHISEFSNLIIINDPTSEASMMYYRANDDLHVSDYELEQIRYVFYKDILYCITIHTKGFTNSRGVLKVLQAAYGDGLQSNKYIETYIWIGNKVNMMYNENSITKDALILIMNNTIYDQKILEEKESINEAIKDL